MLKRIIDYTVKKKREQISKEKYFHFNPTEEVESFIKNEESDTSVGLSFDFISSWYHFNYIFCFLDKQKINYNDLSFSTLYAMESNNWDFFLGKKYPNYDEAIQFHEAIKHVAQMMLLGWTELAIQYGNLLIKMLYEKQYKGGYPVYKHSWFMLEIFCKWQKINLDYTLLNYPKDMRLYQEILNDWDTKNTIQLSKMVNKMVDFRIEESDENEYEDRTPDFPSSNYFIYAIEILIWLNIRERIGLPDYVSDNELMKLSINNWHTQSINMPKIKLIEDAKVKLMKDYPEITFEI